MPGVSAARPIELTAEGTHKMSIRHSTTRLPFPLTCLSIALIAIPGGSLLAQDADTDSEADAEGIVEEVVVTGFRRSLMEAMNVTRDSSSSVSAIVAEDISDFPDLNVAEALQRLPGVAIRREAGEGRNITVRGLGPDFNLTRVNGMEGLGTSGGTDSSGGANRSRQFDFNIFASELFNNIVVRKTAESWVDEGAIGAVIDLRTARPFDYSGLTSVVSAQMQYNDLSEEWNPRVSGMISNTWGSFGAMLAVAYSERDILEEGASTVRWQTNDFVSCSACSSDDEFARVNDAYHPRIPRYGRLVHNQERTGINFALQWQPSENTDIVFEGLIGQLDATRDEQFLEALIRNNEDEMDVVAYNIDDQNNLISGTFNNAFIRIENRHDDMTTDFTQYTLQGEHWFNDDWKLSGLVGTSESDYDNPIQTTIIFDNIVDGYSYDYSGNFNVPAFNYGFDVTNPTNYLYTEFRDRPNDVLNEFDSAKADLMWKVGQDWWLQTGIAWKSYGFSVNEARRDDQVRDILGDSVPVTDAYAILLKGFGSGLGMPSGNDKSWVIPDIGPTAALVDLYNLPAAPRTRDVRSVEEDDTAIYLQANWDFDMGEMVFRGNAGLRYYETELESTGVLSGEPVTATNSYSDTLPSLNLVLEPTDDIVLRAAYAQVISRPTLGSLTPGGSIATFGDPTLSFGNPRLDPFQADAFDLAFEWYFADAAVLSVAGFWKDIDSFTARITEDNVPFDETGLPCDLLDGSPIEGECDTLFTVTRNVNGNGGDLDGWEISFQTPFSFNEDSWLHDFGVVANYTKVDSKVDYAAPGSDTPNYGQLVGLSEDSWNLTLYFENETFSARISGNYRSDYLIRFPDRGVEESTYLDFSSAWNMNESWQLTFEVINITDEFFDQRHIAGTPEVGRPYVYHHTGTNYFIGARWKY
jgi:TonB-dependent receptor